MDFPISLSSPPALVTKEDHFFNACERADLTAIRFYLEDPGCNVNAFLHRDVYPASGSTFATQDVNGLNWASSLGLVNVVELLLASPRIDPSRISSINRTTCIIAAAYRGREDVVRLLMRDPRIDMNAVTKNSHTALACAVLTNSIKVTQLLLCDSRVDVTIGDGDGTPPIFHAVFFGFDEIVGMMLTSMRIDPNCQNNYGGCPLWSAACFGRLKVAQRILASGRHIDTRKTHVPGSLPWSGMTPYQVGKLGLTRAKISFESDEGFKCARAYGSVIADLILAYEKNPTQVQNFLRAQREDPPPPPLLLTC